MLSAKESTVGVLQIVIDVHISIHTLLAGSDDAVAHGVLLPQILIHAPREGGDQVQHHDRPVHGISIHAPREGGDRRPLRHGANLEFQSTPPARGATVEDFLTVLAALISIHAPREGGDWCEE